MFKQFKNEAGVLQSLKYWLREHDIPYKKNAPGYFSQAGESDLEIYLNGQTYYVELKNKSKATMVQIAMLAKKRSQGYKTYLVTNETEMQKLKNDLLEAKEKAL